MRISKIIQGMRNLSRDSSNETMEDVKVKDVFDDVISVFSERFRHQSILLTFVDKDQLMETFIKGKRIQISHVLMNLIGNSFDSLQSNPAPKEITVKLEKSVDTFFIKVSDTGKPIPQETRLKLFQPFFTTKGIGKGTGLGLSISKSIIESHRGKIYLSPNLELNEFIIEMPA